MGWRWFGGGWVQHRSALCHRGAAGAVFLKTAQGAFGLDGQSPSESIRSQKLEEKWLAWSHRTRRWGWVIPVISSAILKGWKRCCLGYERFYKSPVFLGDSVWKAITPFSSPLGGQSVAGLHIKELRVCSWEQEGSLAAPRDHCPPGWGFRWQKRWQQHLSLIQDRCLWKLRPWEVKSAPGCCQFVVWKIGAVTRCAIANVTLQDETLIIYFRVAQGRVLGGSPQIKHTKKGSPRSLYTHFTTSFSH